MKNIISILILIFAVNETLAQTVSPENVKATDNFIEYYNEDNFAAIFSMYSSEMQNALPLNKSNEFLSGLKSQVGKITDRTFMSYNNGTYAAYKTLFEKATLVLNISIDKSNNINGLLIKPYADQKPASHVTNNLSIENDNISQEQQVILYENTKVFPNKTQFSMALIKNGKISFYGLTKQENAINNIENSSKIFEIGSITKVFTSTLMAGYIKNNKIKAHDVINDYLDFELNGNAQITFEKLANHTSGLPAMPANLDVSGVDPKNPYKNYDNSELEAYLKEQLKLENENYTYSNLGAGLLAYTLSTMSNTSYEQMLNKNVFKKFDMPHSSINRKNIKNQLVEGLDKDGNVTSNWDLSALVGAGGILSNVKDLAQFALAQFDPSHKELTLTRQKTAQINDTMDIGMGWHILKGQSKNDWFWHNGGTGGYSSSMVIDPVKKNGVIILSNVSAFHVDNPNIDKMCFQLMQSL